MACRLRAKQSAPYVIRMGTARATIDAGPYAAGWRFGAGRGGREPAVGRNKRGCATYHLVQRNASVDETVPMDSAVMIPDAVAATGVGGSVVSPFERVTGVSSTQTGVPDINGQTTARILVVEPVQRTRRSIEKALQRAGYRTESVAAIQHGIRRLREQHIDMVIVDIRALGPSGISLASVIKERFAVSIVVNVPRITEAIRAALRDGVRVEVLEKPIRTEEMLVRVERTLREHTFVTQHDLTLSQLRAAHRELGEAYLDTIHRLVLASEYRDDNTGDHIGRMARYGALLGLKLGMPPSQVHNLRYAAPMHDVGKIGIPDRVLRKPSSLTEREFEVMKTHTLMGARILSRAKSDILRTGQQVALAHHENWDGSGYPFGLSGNAIPLVGRIVRIVDAFDALTSARPYKDAYPIELALTFIRRGRATLFDPKLTDLVLANSQVLLRMRMDPSAARVAASNAFTLSMRDKDDHPDIDRYV